MVEAKEKFYTCRSDRAFKEVFMREDSKDILSKVLESVLKVKIEYIKFLNLERNVDNINVRRKYFDMFLDTNIGKIQVEVNADYDISKKIRNTAYICDTYSHLTLKGEKYTDDILVIQINLSYENVKDKYINKIMIRDDDNDSYIKNFIIYDINMAKCKKLWYTKDKSFNEYKYIMMLDLEEEELEDLSKKDKVVSKYMKTLEEVNKDPEFREYMSAEEDARKMENSHLDEARNEGLVKGRSEGRIQGLTEGRNERNIEIARNLLKNNIDLSIIIDSTGLSEEEINKLQND